MIFEEVTNVERDRFWNSLISIDIVNETLAWWFQQIEINEIRRDGFLYNAYEYVKPTISFRKKKLILSNAPSWRDISVNKNKYCRISWWNEYDG